MNDALAAFNVRFRRKPRRRLLIGSKKGVVKVFVAHGHSPM